MNNRDRTVIDQMNNSSYTDLGRLEGLKWARKSQEKKSKEW